MCGRYTLSTPAELISEHFDLAETPQAEARYNIAPTQETLIIGTRADATRAAGLASWGISARTGRSTAAARRLINARVETVAERFSFKDSFTRRRCLVPADGFFEWQHRPGGKVPVYFSLRERRVFAFAGIWEPSPDPGGAPRFAILTTRPNAVVEPVHSRMPVMLLPETYDRYLARQPLSAAMRARIAEPYPADSLEHWDVSTYVNSPAHDEPRCILPAGH